MRLGPIVAMGLARAARRPSHYALRALAGLGLLFVAWEVEAFWTGPQAYRGGVRRYDSLAALPRLAEMGFMQMVWVQGALVLLLVPGLVAGAVAEEGRRGLMRDVLASPLSGARIVL